MLFAGVGWRRSSELPLGEATFLGGAAEYLVAGPFTSQRFDRVEHGCSGFAPNVPLFLVVKLDRHQVSFGWTDSGL